MSERAPNTSSAEATGAPASERGNAIGNEAIDLAWTSYKVAMERRAYLEEARRREQSVSNTDLWLYTSLAQEAAAVLAKAWQHEADRLSNLAIDALPEGI